MCFCSKGMLVCLAIAITGFTCYAYICWFLIPYLFVGLPNSSFGSSFKTYGVVLLVIHVLIVTMLFWSLIKTWMTNPGYVSDYFKSVVVHETKESEKITNNYVSNQVSQFINSG
jgi:hypothetical protein